MKDNKKEKLIPELRFPEFEGEWNLSTLGDVSNDVMYGMNSAAKGYDGEHKYIRITDIDEDENTYKPDPLTSPDGDLSEEFKLKKRDLLFARTGASTGKSYLYNEKDGNLYFAGFLIKFHINNAEAKFIHLLVQIHSYDRWVNAVSARSGQPGINAEEYKSYKLYLPSTQEQQKIASFLSLIDKRIELLKKKKELLELYKKGVMQKIFNQEIRFKDEEGNDYPEWEEKRLGEIFRERKEKSSTNNQYPILTSSGEGIFLQKDYFDKQTASSNNVGYKIVYEGDLTYRSMSDTGEFTFNVQDIVKKGLVSPAYPVVVIKDREYTYYLKEYLNNAPSLLKQIWELIEGGTRLALSLTKFKKLVVKIPVEEEVVKISKIFKKIDEYKKFINQELTETKKFKKGLLEKMFI
jgi:type I restriction enzyme S subunit